MNNRLAELKKAGNGSTAIDIRPSGGGGSNSQSPEMLRFYKDVDIVKDHIRKIEKAMGDGKKSVIDAEVPIARKLREHLDLDSNH